MNAKFAIGDTVTFEGLTGEIIEIEEYDIEDFNWTPSYAIKVNLPWCLHGYAIFHRAEEKLTKN